MLSEGVRYIVLTITLVVVSFHIVVCKLLINLFLFLIRKHID